NERFKPSNILTLALIPRPNELSLHRLNHYLAPLVDQLIELWYSIDLSETFEHSDRKTIKTAVICCSCDIPAARKLCGHISARIACYRCLKHANYDDRNQPNFGGLDDMNNWFVERDVEEIKNNAFAWKQFIDPMHCLFLGIAKWIVTRLWIEKGKLTPQNLSLMQKRASNIQVPVDIGRIPSKISTGEGFSGFSADHILVCRIVSISGLKEAHTRLVEMIKDIEREYEPKKIIPNLHAFWCFSTERINGLLDGHRKIEIELIKIIQHNALLDELTSYADQNPHLQEVLIILKPRDSVRSLSMYDEYTDEDYKAFRLLSTTIEEGAAFGFEIFPGSFLGPSKKDVLLTQDIYLLLTEFYCNVYEKDFVALSHIHNASEHSIPVLPKVNQFSRLKIGTEIFGSILSYRHAKSAKILAQFILNDDTIETFPGQVQFFFEHTVYLQEGPRTHYLAFVRWYKPAKNRKTRFYFKINDDANSCNIELWSDKFYEMGRDCIIPIHNILCRFVSGTFEVGQRNLKKYMAVIPINRKFHI
ncbi:hypothetical protein RhiirA4_467785, partial [Rhizophagus irregularis]